MVEKMKAFDVTRTLGLSDEEVEPILQDLLRMYNNNWTLIQEDNYRVLVDAIFEHEENKGVEDKSRGLMGHDGSGRPAKRLHVAGQEKRTSLPIKKYSSKELALEESETRLTSSRKQIMKSSQPCASNRRLESRSLESHLQPNNNRDVSISSDVAPGVRDNKSKSVRAVYLKETTGETTCSHVPRENVPSKLPKKGLPKPTSTEKRINDLPPSSVIRAAEQKKPPLRVGHSVTDSNGKKSSSSEYSESRPNTHEDKRPVNFLKDITKGAEKVKISLVDEIGKENLPKFNYIPHSIIYQNAHINISLARIVDEDCCSSCSGDCLSSPIPCACARETDGEFAYTPEGQLKERFLRACMTRKEEPQEDHFVYCQDCPIERSKDDINPEKCKGHLIRKFIKECWRKCGCDMKCGNRVVQRGIACKLQVFLTREGKGWGLRSLETLPQGTFICEYIGEVLTNTELYDRNMGSGKERHTYPVTLDADWGSEGILRDEEALCLDATSHGNVARFINHRCTDANLVDIPVEVETPDRHYYHLAFFTTRNVAAFEELTWDYGIDFDDEYHPIKAFHCSCGSAKCRDRNRKSRK